MQGSGSARRTSPIVTFIPFGAPGDVADVQIDRKKHSYAEGHIVRLVAPSPVRVEPRCRHFTVCGGCKWQHLPYAEQLKWKQQQVTDALTRIAKVELPEISPILGSSEIWAYRNKMEYTFSDKKWRTWEEVKSGKDFEDSSNALGSISPEHSTRCFISMNAIFRQTSEMKSVISSTIMPRSMVLPSIIYARTGVFCARS